MKNSLNIELSELEFEKIAEGDDPAARLMATVEIAGTHALRRSASDRARVRQGRLSGRREDGPHEESVNGVAGTMAVRCILPVRHTGQQVR